MREIRTRKRRREKGGSWRVKFERSSFEYLTFVFLVIYYDGETKFTGHGREKRQRRGRTKREGREGEGEKRGERRDQKVGGIE